MNVQPTYDRDTAIDGQRHLSASNGLQGRTSTGVMSPVVVVHVPARSTESERVTRRPDDGRLAPTDSSVTEVSGVPDQSRPVIAGGVAEGTGLGLSSSPSPSISRRAAQLYVGQYLEQVAQLSQRNCAAWWVSFGWVVDDDVGQ